MSEHDLTFTPDGRFAAFGLRDDVVIIDAAVGRVYQILAGDGDEVSRVEFESSGLYLHSCYDGGAAIRWDWRRGVRIADPD